MNERSATGSGAGAGSLGAVVLSRTGACAGTDAGVVVGDFCFDPLQPISPRRAVRAGLEVKPKRRRFAPVCGSQTHDTIEWGEEKLRIDVPLAVSIASLMPYHNTAPYR